PDQDVEAGLPARLTAALLEDAANDATLGAHRGAVDRDRLRAGDERNDGGNFFGRLKTLKKRSRADRRKKLLFDFGFRDALLFGHVFHEPANAFRGRWPGKNGVDRDA